MNTDREIIVGREMWRMAPHWDHLTTFDQIANASDYMNDLLFIDQDDFIKEQAYRDYLHNQGTDNFHRIRCEIALYRCIGQISSYFLGDDYNNDYLVVDKVLAIAEEWQILEAEGWMPLLPNFDAVQTMESHSPPQTRAQLLRGYMDRWKVQTKVTQWDKCSLNTLRHLMFEVRRIERRRQRGESDPLASKECFGISLSTI